MFQDKGAYDKGDLCIYRAVKQSKAKENKVGVCYHSYKNEGSHLHNPSRFYDFESEKTIFSYLNVEQILTKEIFNAILAL